MSEHVPYHTAYVLWLIRERAGISWADLCLHFEMDPGGSQTQHSMLRSSLHELSDAQLIKPDRHVDFNGWGFPDPDVRFSVTPLSQQILHVLRLSLSELARTDPSQRLIVTPVLEKTFGKRFESEILVFMPFLKELVPVYEDHLKSVAQKLGRTIARADEFLTNDQIVNEIWTALVDTKLVVADCTHRNPNVFYELGLAHAIGKPTVLITQNDEDIPFDLRHRRYLKYELTPRGMRSFEESLLRTITTVLAAETTGQ